MKPPAKLSPAPVESTGTTLRPQIFGGLQRGFGQTAVFLNPEIDRPYTPTRVSMAFQRTCQRAGLFHARSHDLMHTFVTKARRAKIDYVRIMAITEHKTLRVFSATTSSTKGTCKRP